MKEKLAKIREEILKQIDASENLDKLNEVRVSALGKKGALTELLKSMKEVARRTRFSCMHLGFSAIQHVPVYQPSAPPHFYTENIISASLVR